MEKSALVRPIWLTANDTVWLHTESEGGVPHLHAAVCRMDEEGNINNDHNIHLRAQRAAERVTKKRGWTTAAQVRNSNIHQVNRDCLDALKSMQSWSWEEYKVPLYERIIRYMKEKMETVSSEAMHL